MPRTSVAQQLSDALDVLMAERQQCADRVAEIDALFARYGVAVSPRKSGPAKRGPGKPGTRKPGRPRKRRVYDQTAEQFVLSLVAGKGTTTAQINKAWTDSGRKGSANNTLTKLAKAKQIKRQKVKGGRGSTYTAA